jgi:hypothetical protein
MDISNRQGVRVGPRAFCGKVEFALQQSSQHLQKTGVLPADGRFAGRLEFAAGSGDPGGVGR